jgi:hypothetical protein
LVVAKFFATKHETTKKAVGYILHVRSSCLPPSPRLGRTAVALAEAGRDFVVAFLGGCAFPGLDREEGL